MPHYCETDGCESEAVEIVPVSIDDSTVEYRKLCYPCSEAYNTGAQHGRFRAYRQLKAYANSLKDQGFVTEGGVIFAALAKLDSVDDPIFEGRTPASLDDEEDEG